MVSAVVSIDLGNLHISDLIKELESRKGCEEYDFSHLEVGALIMRLETLGCPQSIIGQLEEWDSLPIVGIRELQQWKVFCGA